MICNVGEDVVEVQYDDCQRAQLTSAQLRPLQVGIGSRVYVRWKGGPSYYPGRITMAEGGAVHVEYDDGDKEWATVSAMRVHNDDL